MWRSCSRKRNTADVWEQTVQTQWNSSDSLSTVNFLFSLRSFKNCWYVTSISWRLFSCVSLSFQGLCVRAHTHSAPAAAPDLRLYLMLLQQLHRDLSVGVELCSCLTERHSPLLNVYCVVSFPGFCLLLVIVVKSRWCLCPTKQEVRLWDDFIFVENAETGVKTMGGKVLREQWQQLSGCCVTKIISDEKRWRHRDTLSRQRRDWGDRHTDSCGPLASRCQYAAAAAVTTKSTSSTVNFLLLTNTDARNVWIHRDDRVLWSSFRETRLNTGDLETLPQKEIFRSNQTQRLGKGDAYVTHNAAGHV